MELDNNAHSVFLLYYHLVLVVKYRRQVFDETVSERSTMLSKKSPTSKVGDELRPS